MVPAIGLRIGSLWIEADIFWLRILPHENRIPYRRIIWMVYHSPAARGTIHDACAIVLCHADRAPTTRFSHSALSRWATVQPDWRECAPLSYFGMGTGDKMDSKTANQNRIADTIGNCATIGDYVWIDTYDFDHIPNMCRDQCNCISTAGAVCRSPPSIRAAHVSAESRKVATARNGNSCRALNLKCHPKMLIRIAMSIKSLGCGKMRKKNKKSKSGYNIHIRLLCHLVI